MRRVGIVVLGILVIAAAALWWVLPAGPPSQPPVYSATPPAMEDGHHAVHIAKTIVNMEPAAFRVWVKSNPMVRFLKPRGPISPPVAFDPITGVWPEAGAARRSRLADGHYLAEKVLVTNSDAGFRYQVWGFTNIAGVLVRYAAAEFKYLHAGNGRTELVWEYKLRANATPLQPVADWFLKTQFAPVMDAAVKAMAEAAEPQR